MNDTENISDKTLKSELFRIRIQKFWGQLLFLPLGSLIIFLLKYVQGYRIHNLQEIRRQYRELSSQKRPLLICPNHLTMIDSIILHWAFGSVPFYLFHFRSFSWNVPAVENFKNTVVRSLVTYLGKCIPIDRNGSREHHDLVLQKTQELLRKGEPFTIFAEGGRSRTGRIDMENVKYGIGKIVEGVENCQVLCVYLRGDHQTSYGELPVKNEKFTVMMELLPLSVSGKGLRAQREISQQIMQKLKDMEDVYFSQRQ